MYFLQINFLHAMIYFFINNIMKYFGLILFLTIIILFNLFIHFRYNEGYASLKSRMADETTRGATFGGSGANLPETTYSDKNYDSEGRSKLHYKFAETSDQLNKLLDYSNSRSDYDVEYHDSPEKIAEETGYGLNTNTYFVFDPTQQKLVAVEYPIMYNLPVFYSPNEYKYDAKSYVPSYTDGVVLSLLR
jgi:hypothetical protein